MLVAATICVSLLIMSSCKFSGEHSCAKESHSESASSRGLWCVGALGVVPFSASILLHTTDELMLLLQSVGSSHAYTVWYTLCMPFVLAPDSLVMHVFYIPLVWYCTCAWPS